MKPLEERVNEFMTSLGFELDMEEEVFELWGKDFATSAQFRFREATFMYRQSLEARRSELKSMRETLNLGNDDFGWDEISDRIAELNRLLRES